MGWAKLVSSLLTLHLLLISLDGVSSSPQLWGTEPWEPERRAKSLGFLGRDAHETIDNNSLTAARDDDSKHDKDDGKDDDKKAILNVSDKDSPYALIDKYFPERESYFYQNHNKFQTEYRQLPADKREDIGDLNPNEVWLSDDSLLVLKGGFTPNRKGFDNPWKPIDNFQAPYREPVLPPPDFDPDTLDIGVGVPIETIIAERKRQKEEQELRRLVTPSPSPLPRLVAVTDNSLLEHERTGHSSPRKIQEFIKSVKSPDPLQPFKDEVEGAQKEFKLFLDDVSKYINDMENFHSVKQQSASKTLVRTLPPPTSPSPSSYSPFTTTTSRPSSPAPPNSYPISYASPNAKVYLSTQYVTHPPPSSSSTSSPVQSTPQPKRKQARSTQSPVSTAAPVSVTTVSPVYRERSSTTLSPGQQGHHSGDQEDWTPVTTSAPRHQSTYNREDEFKTVVKQLPARPPLAPVRHSIKPSDVLPVTTPSYAPSPTPYSLFQSVPENIQETDVFHLSQNVDFGKKLGIGAAPPWRPPPPPSHPSHHSVAYNEVDTGRRVSPQKGRYAVTVTTNSPPLRRHHSGGGGGVSLDKLLPALFTSKRSRSRATIRRRRPKLIETPTDRASDRQGNGDVRYVSFFSGGVGGNSWGYSYNLGK